MPQQELVRAGAVVLVLEMVPEEVGSTFRVWGSGSRV